MPEKTDSASLLLLGRNAKPGSQSYTCVKRLNNVTKKRVTELYLASLASHSGKAEPGAGIPLCLAQHDHVGALVVNLTRALVPQR